MVNTRSQARSSIPVFMSKTSRNDRVSDSESECSIPDLLTRDQIDELDNENLIHSEQHSDQMTIDQRFSSMNRQINELTGLVLALTEKLSSSLGEGNDQNTVIDKTNARSDKGLDHMRRFLSPIMVCILLSQRRLAIIPLNTCITSEKVQSFLVQSQILLGVQE